jgi:hypothetical protein
MDTEGAPRHVLSVGMMEFPGHASTCVSVRLVGSRGRGDFERFPDHFTLTTVAFIAPARPRPACPVSVIGGSI